MLAGPGTNRPIREGEGTNRAGGHVTTGTTSRSPKKYPNLIHYRWFSFDLKISIFFPASTQINKSQSKSQNIPKRGVKGGALLGDTSLSNMAPQRVRERGAYKVLCALPTMLPIVSGIYHCLVAGASQGVGGCFTVWGLPRFVDILTWVSMVAHTNNLASEPVFNPDGLPVE